MPDRPPVHRPPGAQRVGEARGHRVAGSAARRGYGWAWAKARSAFLARNPLCAQCGVAATDVDHIVPHRGDRQAFWDASNWQSLCKACHGAKTAKEVVR